MKRFVTDFQQNKADTSFQYRGISLGCDYSTKLFIQCMGLKWWNWKIVTIGLCQIVFGQYLEMVEELVGSVNDTLKNLTGFGPFLFTVVWW